jgi:glycosyltransferase involved in cell wall biosynthesis
MFAVSTESAEGLRTAGVPAAKVQIVHLGTDPSAYHPDAEARESLRRELGLDVSVRIVLSTSHLRPGKGVDLLPEVAARLAVDPGGVAVLAAGSGPLRAAIERDAAYKGLDGTVFRLLGTREDVPRLLAAADVFILPTNGAGVFREGFPLSVLEAMSAGTPVVATDVADLSKLLGTACHIVPPGDIEALTETCRDLFTNPVTAHTAADAARRLVEERFSVEAAAAAYMKHYLGEC